MSMKTKHPMRSTLSSSYLYDNFHLSMDDLISFAKDAYAEKYSIPPSNIDVSESAHRSCVVRFMIIREYE